jgi:hypothetical protein
MACVANASSNGNTVITRVITEGAPYFMKFNTTDADQFPGNRFSFGFRRYTDAGGGDEVFIWVKFALTTTTYKLRLPGNASPKEILQFDFIVAQLIKMLDFNFELSITSKKYTFTIIQDSRLFPTTFSYSLTPP